MRPRELLEIKRLDAEEALVQLHIWSYVYFSKLRELEVVVGCHTDLAWASSSRVSVCLYDDSIYLPVTLCYY